MGGIVTLKIQSRNKEHTINALKGFLDMIDLEVSESVLTGESLPVDKFIKKLKLKTLLAEQQNMLFTGTQIVRGNAKAIVVSTGMLHHGKPKMFMHIIYSRFDGGQGKFPEHPW